MNNISIIVTAFSLSDSRLVSSQQSRDFNISASSALATGAFWPWPKAVHQMTRFLVRLRFKGTAKHCNEYLFSKDDLLSFSFDNMRTVLKVTWNGTAIRIENAMDAVAVSVSLDLLKDKDTFGKGDTKCRDVADDPRINAIFSDNFFHMVGGETRIITARISGGRGTIPPGSES